MACFVFTANYAPAINEGIEEKYDTGCVILDKCIYRTVQAAFQWVKSLRIPYKD